MKAPRPFSGCRFLLWAAALLLSLVVPSFAGHAGRPDKGAFATPTPDPRLYIRVHREDQRAGAEAVRRALAGVRLGGRPLTAMAPTVQPNNGARTPQVTCVTAADCKLAPELAALLAPIVGRPVRVTDIAARYPAPGTRPYHYELLFDDPPIGKAAPNSAPSARPPLVAAPLPPPASAAPALPHRLPLTLTWEKATRVTSGDVVTLRFADPSRSPRSFAAAIDGVPAAVLDIGDGIQVIVPPISRNIFSRRQVPLAIEIGARWRVDPLTLTLRSYAEQWLGWIAGLALAALLGGAWLPEIIAGEQPWPGWLSRIFGPAPKERVVQKPASPGLFGPRVIPLAGTARPPRELVEACAFGESLLFIGGEASRRPAYPSDVEALADILATADAVPAEVKTEGQQLLDRGETDTVADLLATRLGRGAFAAELARHLAAPRGPEASCRPLNTTPFGGLIDLGFGSAALPAVATALRLTTRSQQDFSTLLRSSVPFVLRLRGDLERPDELLLTGLEIARALDEVPRLRSVLNAMFASRTVLFAGIPADRLASALEVAGIRSAGGRRHFALVDQVPSIEIWADRFRDSYGIDFIILPAGEDAASFLGALAAEVEKSLPHGATAAAPEAAPLDRARVSRLELRNIGPFAQLDVEFKEQWTMLLGNNGAGKSTLLRAIAVALSGDDPTLLEPAQSLLRRGEESGSIALTLTNGRSPIVFRSLLTMVQGRLSIAASTAPLQAGALSAFGFPAMRGVTATGQVDLSRDESFPHPRVADVLPIVAGGTDDRGRSLRQWIFRVYLKSQDSHVGSAERQRAHEMIASLFRLLDSMTPGFELRFSRCNAETGEILLKTSDGELPMDYVSQGMSSTIGWIGPMIQRLYEIGGEMSRPEDQHAILLIDEIESHLHPAWQQKLVGSLRQHFPNVQVIATTHSPLTVGNLGERQVLRVLRGPEGLSVEYLEQSFIGYRFDQILTDAAFGLDRARSDDWKVREDYAALLGKSSRTDGEERKLRWLEGELRKLPPLAETPAERRALNEGKQVLKDALQAAAASKRHPGMLEEPRSEEERP